VDAAPIAPGGAQALINNDVIAVANVKLVDVAAIATNEGAALTAARDWLTEKLALPRYDWLREAYEERPDPEGERWQQAREAAEAERVRSERPTERQTARAA
jgi:hypothetical protein